ncbi:hypothetical protein ACJZ2D_016190 [Fusarium nematophilum]
MSTDDKEFPGVHDAAIGHNDGVDEKEGNAADRADMCRMGKVQEMRRNFRFLSIFGFSMILMASWEFSLSVSTIGLVNGGTAGLIWMFFICWVGFLMVNMSMAEMASISLTPTFCRAPTTGGQYHWVSEFAPPRYQKFISYIMGWMCVLGWQTSCASSAFIAGTQIQGLVVLNYPDYVPEAWHGTLLSVAVAASSVLFNTVLARKLPLIEALVLIIHIFAFFGVLVTLWVLSPRADAKAVFTEFSDSGGWGSLGGSTLVGVLAGVLPLLGADAAVHMSEELRDASHILPRSMIMTTVFNGALGWIMVITYCFCIGDLGEVIASPTGYPFMQVFYNSTHPWFSNVPAGWDVPLNAILTTFLISSLLSLINIGSAVALNSITSLATTSLLSSYIVSISCMIWRRWTKSPLLPSKFNLGDWGLTINIASEAFLVVIFVLAFMPGNPNPTPSEMNWNILIYGAVTIFSLAYYFRGTHRYEGPVAYVRALQP